MDTPNDLKLSEETTFKSHFTQVTSFSKVVAAIVFITLPFVGLYVGTQYTHPTPVTETFIPLKEKSVSEPQYKNSFLGGEIPASWSEYYAEAELVEDENPYRRESVTYSISSGRVSFGDVSWEQIDFRFASKDAVDLYLGKIKQMMTEDAGILMTEELIDNTPITVIQWPLDNGEVTKAGSGGKTYVIKLNQTNDSPSYLLISKQAKGSPEFEQHFNHYIETINFSNILTTPWFEYAYLNESGGPSLGE